MLTTYFKNLLAASGPDIVYAGLFTGGAPGSGTEISPETLYGEGQARPAIALAAPDDGARYPEADVLRTLVTAQNVTHVAWFDAEVDGNLLGHMTFERNYPAGDQIRFPSDSPVYFVDDREDQG